MCSDLLVWSYETTVCEWKGAASYWTLAMHGYTVRNLAWGYEGPSQRYRSIAHHSLLPGPGRPLHGKRGARTGPPCDFYSGWVTDEILVSFKGSPGSSGWRGQGWETGCGWWKFGPTRLGAEPARKSTTGVRRFPGRGGGAGPGGGLPGPPARRRGSEKGGLQEEPLGGVFVEPADHGLGRPEAT
ncbi:DUF427 domain-containing protein [Streptomyces sp. NPDC056519]|uniref:DUF427 domain-containing protein n=1 Tax=Streptomyces sp. NPDC056519 TaxID=3345849 RepID=UPI0036AE8A68